MKVLFVCTGNSCRSPMAELYFDHYCKQLGKNNIDSGSAGIYACDGSPISIPAEAVMRQLGIDGGKFRSRRFTAQLAAEFDLIIAMTRGHLEAIKAIAPSAGDKCRLLLDSQDVPDPFGGSVKDYLQVFNTMKLSLEKLGESINV